jgi:membrane protein implicated in regulation of membrane protease activity
MIWWQWLVFGLLLLGAEMAVDAQFFLVFLGFSAVVVGLLGVTPLSLPIWGQWVVFSTIAVVNLLVFRSRVYSKIRGNIPDRSEGVVGEIGLVNEEIASGAIGSATLRGSVWQARNIGPAPIAAGSEVIVEGSTGLILSVRAEGREPG